MDGSSKKIGWIRSARQWIKGTSSSHHRHHTGGVQTRLFTQEHNVDPSAAIIEVLPSSSSVEEAAAKEESN